MRSFLTDYGVDALLAILVIAGGVVTIWRARAARRVSETQQIMSRNPGSPLGTLARRVTIRLEHARDRLDTWRDSLVHAAALTIILSRVLSALVPAAS